MGVTRWLLHKFKDINSDRMKKHIEVIHQNSGKSKAYIVFDMFVNLMPVSKYKAKELYKQVSAIESAEDTFDDAAVGDSLTIAVLRKNANVFESYDDLDLMKVSTEYIDFYKLNSCVKSSYIIFILYK